MTSQDPQRCPKCGLSTNGRAPQFQGDKCKCITELELTTQQNDTVVEELLRLAKGDTPTETVRRIRECTITLRESVYADEMEGAVSFSINHPGTGQDDWSFSGGTVLTDGTFYDSDPVKPWELA